MPLAYLTAKTNGLEEDAARIGELLASAGLPLPTVREDAQALLPPTPIIREENWPLLTVSRSAFDPTMAQPESGAGVFSAVPACQ